jgi:hypothetical protein
LEIEDAEGVFRLNLGDLIPGAGGEVVLFNDSALRGIVLETRSAPESTGKIDAHVTAEGVDVGGFRFLRFADGLIVFHDPGTRVTIDVARG